MQRDAVCMAQEGCGTKNQIPPRNNSMFYHKVSNTCQELPRLHETWETTYSPNPHPHHSKHSTRRQVCFLCLLAPSLGGPRSRVAWLPPSAATSILDDLENQPSWGQFPPLEMRGWLTSLLCHSQPLPPEWWVYPVMLFMAMPISECPLKLHPPKGQFQRQCSKVIRGAAHCTGI